MANNNIAIVTGAGRGIGRGIALALAGAGWTVIVNYRSNDTAATETVALVEAAGGTGLQVQADIGSENGRQHLITTTLATYGQINLLVNNAGIAPAQRLDVLEMSAASYDRVMDVNLKGPLLLTQLVAKEMIALINQQKIVAPQIINISSISAYTSSPGRAEYCISKAGMSMMTKLFADRLAEYGIHVFEIRPGIIATDMTDGVKQKYDQLILEEGLTPIRRWGQPDDIGRAVMAIAAGHFPFSTGEVINVDGGFHLHRL